MKKKEKNPLHLPCMILFKVDNDEMEGLVLQILCLHLSLLIKQALSEAGEVKFTANLM